ncbi:MAG: hypothetical protein JO168_05635 [Solirubrobacterales bacterium]|nr:hypothetical protein [Solirubrobacterales bacterium]
MNRRSIAAAAFSIAAIAAGTGVPVAAASTAHPTTAHSGVAFTKQDGGRDGFAKWIGPRHGVVEASAADAFMKITGPDVSV